MLFPVLTHSSFIPSSSAFLYYTLSLFNTNFRNAVRMKIGHSKFSQIMGTQKQEKKLKEINSCTYMYIHPPTPTFSYIIPQWEKEFLYWPIKIFFILCFSLPVIWKNVLGIILLPHMKCFPLGLCYRRDSVSIIKMWSCLNRKQASLDIKRDFSLNYTYLCQFYHV